MSFECSSVSIETAKQLDARDPLASFRDRFLLPQGVYLDGMSAITCFLIHWKQMHMCSQHLMCVSTVQAIVLELCPRPPLIG